MLRAHTGSSSILKQGPWLGREVPRGLAAEDCAHGWGYVYDPTAVADIESIATTLSFRMPEMHVWCFDPEKKEIVDFSCADQIKLCDEWVAKPPPGVIWGKASRYPRAIYQPDDSALDLASLGALTVLHDHAPETTEEAFRDMGFRRDAM